MARPCSSLTWNQYLAASAESAQKPTASRKTARRMVTNFFIGYPPCVDDPLAVRLALEVLPLHGPVAGLVDFGLGLCEPTPGRNLLGPRLPSGPPRLPGLTDDVAIARLGGFLRTSLVIHWQISHFSSCTA